MFYLIFTEKLLLKLMLLCNVIFSQLGASSDTCLCLECQRRSVALDYPEKRLLANLFSHWLKISPQESDNRKSSCASLQPINAAFISPRWKMEAVQKENWYFLVLTVSLASLRGTVPLLFCSKAQPRTSTMIFTL